VALELVDAAHHNLAGDNGAAHACEQVTLFGYWVFSGSKKA